MPRASAAGPCAVVGCDADGPYTRRLCRGHYARLRRYGDPEGRPALVCRPQCSVDGCGRESVARSWCLMHYKRWRNNGDPVAMADRSASAIAGWARRRPIVINDEGKECSQCGEFKRFSEFYSARRSTPRGRHSSLCRPCQQEAISRWEQRFPDRKALSDWISYLTKYGLTPQRWEALMDEQNGRCPICQSDITERGVVDHDHACCAGGRSCGSCVRGLLCVRCNWGLGHFDDDPGSMRRAADYIDRSERQRERAELRTAP